MVMLYNLHSYIAIIRYNLHSYNAKSRWYNLKLSYWFGAGNQLYKRLCRCYGWPSHMLSNFTTLFLHLNNLTNITQHFLQLSTFLPISFSTFLHLINLTNITEHFLQLSTFFPISFSTFLHLINLTNINKIYFIIIQFLVLKIFAFNTDLSAFQFFYFLISQVFIV